MRLLSCVYQDLTQVAILHDNQVVLPAKIISDWPSTMLELIDRGPVYLKAITLKLINQLPRVTLAQVQLLAPIPRPRKNIMCLGLNYAEHAEESLAAWGKERTAPEDIIVFTKAVTSVIGPDENIHLDTTVTTQLDWEVELAVIIGRPGRKIAVADAFDHIFGYTIINDISARDLQFRHKQYFLGKSIDGGCPLGPWIVTKDDIADPQTLELKLWVNGVLKQHANTRQMLSPVAKIISSLSHSLTLEPGDIIATGTPAGVGFARQPPEFLQAGDTIECEIEKIGRLVNAVTAAV